MPVISSPSLAPHGVVTITATAYTALDGQLVLVNAAANNVTITVPNTANATVVVKRIDSGSNIVSVVASSGTIDGDVGGATLVGQNAAGTFVGDGTNVQIETANGALSYGPQAGTIQLYSGATAPTGYLLCDGSAVSRTTYATLFAICSTTYGVGDGSTTFNLPDLTGRVPVGYKVGDANFGTRGGAGGEATHVLSTAEMPSHSHSWGSGQTFGVNFGGNPGGFAVFQLHLDAVNTNTYQGPYVDQNTGGGGAHNNVQPFVTVNYIIKT